MPEGDTNFRTATTLRAALLGREVVAFDAPRLVGRRPEKGWRVEGVDARGKHLLIHFADGDRGLTLRTHLRMNGAWHLCRPGERWRKSPRARPRRPALPHLPDPDRGPPDGPAEPRRPLVPGMSDREPACVRAVGGSLRPVR
ncbi:MAG: DNA-formamidopyrimidine glycosylase family protein [Nitriliruptorales bacterium]